MARGPELVQFFEISVHGRRVQHQQPGRPALHEREVAAGLVRDGLERHHVPARGQHPSLSRWHDLRHDAYSAHVSDLLADAEAELYEADPDGFTARRAELAAAARDAGEPAVAKQITSLRKPTRSAWVVNRLVRSDPGVRSRLDALAADLRTAADGTRIRELTAARARLVDELTRTALRAAELSAPPAALREEVTATLDAAIADPEVAAGLGTLVRAAHYAGFGALPDGLSAPAPAVKAKAKDPAEAEAEREARRREKIMEAERSLAHADRDLQAALAAEHDLEETVGGLEAELADARQRLAEARRQAYRAESRQQRAAQQLGRLRE